MDFDYGYASNFGLLTGLIAAYYVLMDITLVLLAIVIIANWRIFSKAYVPGWNCLVPVLSSYRFLQIAGMNPNLVFLMFIPFVGAMIVGILMIIARYKLTLLFGGSKGMAVLSIFFGGLVCLILAFSSKYDYMGAE